MTPALRRMITGLPNQNEIGWVVDSFHDGTISIWKYAYTLGSTSVDVDSDSTAYRITIELRDTVASRMRATKGDNYRLSPVAFLPLYRTLHCLINYYDSGQYLRWNWRHLQTVGELGAQTEMLLMVPAAWVRDVIEDSKPTGFYSNALDSPEIRKLDWHD